MTSPSSIRFDAEVTSRLSSFVARHPGWTKSSVAARLVDEGLRMEEHPGVIFREGPAGRRASLQGGPDVWEVVRSVKLSREAEPALSAAEIVQLVEDNTGVPGRLVNVALAYWAAYPEEVEALLDHAARVEGDAAEAARRTAELLGR